MKSRSVKHTLSIQKSNSIFGFFTTLPAMLILIALFIYPLLFSLYVSFTDYNMAAVLGKKAINFVGLENYKNVISDTAFWNSMRVTILITAIAIVIEFILALALAVSTSRVERGKAYFIAIFLITIMMAPIVVALLFRFILNDELGLLNLVLRKIGLISADIGWLSDEHLAKLSVIIVDTWQATSSVFLLLYTAIIAIPKDIFESANVDGASKWRVLINIILPSIKNVILYAMIIRFMDLFRIFDSIFLLTNGGPGNATESMALLIFRIGWTQMDMSKASASSYLMMLVMAFGIMMINRIGNYEKNSYKSRG